MGIRPPTRMRMISHGEYQLVSRVFGNTLPYRARIIVTNGAGLEGRAFTIPTSLLSTLLGTNPADFFASVPLGYLASIVNLAYLMNVGSDYATLGTGANQRLLVHETAHVWQGKNSTFALSYVFSSLVNQCFRDDAYAYTAGRTWSSYNAEQQASIVEDWFASGEPPSGPLYPYIANHVRAGDA
jgi:hypothetical protein